MPIIISPLVCIFCLHFVFHCQEKWYYYIHILYYTIHTSNRMDKYFDRLTDDLESYAHHAKRKTIEMEDAVLLLKRFVWRIANHLNVKWPGWCHVMRTYSIVPERQQFLIYNLNYCSCGSGRNFKVFDFVLNESQWVQNCLGNVENKLWTVYHFWSNILSVIYTDLIPFIILLVFALQARLCEWQGAGGGADRKILAHGATQDFNPYRNEWKYCCS